MKPATLFVCEEEGFFRGSRIAFVIDSSKRVIHLVRFYEIILYENRGHWIKKRTCLHTYLCWKKPSVNIDAITFYQRRFYVRPDVQKYKAKRSIFISFHRTIDSLA